MMFLWSARTVELLEFGSENAGLSVVYFLIIIYYLIRYSRKQLYKPLFSILCVFFIWYIAICFKYGEIQSIYAGILISTVLAFCAFCIYKRSEFFFYAERVLTHLCVLSLVVWGLYCLFPSVVGSVMDSLSVGNNDSTMRANLLVVGIGNQDVEGFSLKRNIGFTWEAGRYSCFLVLGLFINLSLHKMSISWVNNKSFYILLLGLLSTISTTGIMSSLVVLLYYVYNKSAAYRSAIIVLGWLLLPALWGLSFIGDKIGELLDYEEEISNMQYIFSEGSVSITPQRITGAYLEFQNFIHDFWLGYVTNENSYTVKYLFSGADVWLSDGFIQIFSMYGIFIGSFFYILLFRSSLLLSNVFNTKGTLLFAFLFIMISFSYSFWNSSIFLYIIYYCWFNSNKQTETPTICAN